MAQSLSMRVEEFLSVLMVRFMTAPLFGHQSLS